MDDHDAYLAAQRVIHIAGTALTQIIPTERLYVLSFGSQQANRHVHPRRPGLPTRSAGPFAGFATAGWDVSEYLHP